MKLIRYLITLCLALFAFSCIRNSNRFTTANKITISETKLLTTIFSHDSLEGRAPGTKGHHKALIFAVEYFKKNRITSFYDSLKDPFHYDDITTHNIIALIGDKNRNKTHILISAHLDHLGVNKKNSTDSIFNGANDNASGVTAVLQIAKQLNSETKLDSTNVIIALFSGEEDGLLGSQYLAKKFKKEKVNLQYVINFDMVGTKLTDKPEEVYVTGFLKSDVASVMNRHINGNFINYFPDETRYGLFYRSDNYPFYKELNIPSHTISTFDFKNFEHYHKTSDEISGLDIKNLTQIIKNSHAVIQKMLKTKERIKLAENH